MELPDNIEEKAYWLCRRAVAANDNELGNQALDLYRTILSVNPCWPQAYLHSADIHSFFRRAEQAKSILQEGVKQVSKNEFGPLPLLEELYLKLAEAHMSEFEYEEALRQYEQLLKEFPNSRRGQEGFKRADYKKRELEHILKLANPTFPLLP